MGNTNFKSTISSYGVPVHPSKDGMITGDVYFVDSGQASASDSHKGTSPDRALLTIDAAVGKCTANNGDVIYVMPGHTENVASAGAIDLDVAGITIIGLGKGSDRPTLTWSSSTSSDLDVDAANITIENFLFTASVDAVAAAIDVNAKDFTIRNCEFRDTTAFKTVMWVTTPLTASTGTADRLTIEGCTVKQNTAGAAQFVLLIGGHDAVTIKDNRIRGNYSVSPIANTSTELTNWNLEGNVIENLNATNLCVTIDGDTDGFISDNYFRGTTAATVITAVNNCSLYENYYVYTDAKTGKILGTVES